MLEVPLSALGSIPNPTLSTCWYWYFSPISAYRWTFPVLIHRYDQLHHSVYGHIPIALHFLFFSYLYTLFSLLFVFPIFSLSLSLYLSPFFILFYIVTFVVLYTFSTRQGGHTPKQTPLRVSIGLGIIDNNIQPHNINLSIGGVFLLKKKLSSLFLVLFTVWLGFFFLNLFPFPFFRGGKPMLWRSSFSGSTIWTVFRFWGRWNPNPTLGRVDCFFKKKLCVFALLPSAFIFPL